MIQHYYKFRVWNEALTDRKRTEEAAALQSLPFERRECSGQKEMSIRDGTQLGSIVVLNQQVQV